MNRRDLFISAAASAAAIAVPTIRPQFEETPVMRAFREWQAYTAWLETVSMSDDDMEAATNVMTDMEDAMMAIPAENTADFIAKVVAYTHDGWSGLPIADTMPEFWAEAKRFIGGAA